MKKISLLFVAMFSVIVGNSQTDASVMIHSYDTTSMMSDNRIITTLPSGENLVVSNFDDLGGNMIINIKKILSNGTVATVKNIVVPGASAFSWSIEGLSSSPTGDYTCLFRIAYNFYIIKFNAGGTLLWQKQIDVPENTTPYFFHSFNETSGGEYYISVSDYNFMGIIKIDANGNLLWNKKLIGPRATGKSPGFCSEVTESGGCISTLKDGDYETIVNLAPDGSLVWSRSFVDSYRWTKSIKADNLGNFFVMGSYGVSGDTFIQKIDSDGNFIFAKNISGTSYYEDAFVSNTNEYFILSQYPALKLTKFGATGNALWSKGVGATDQSMANITGNTFFSKSHTSTISFISWVNSSTNIILKFSTDLSELCNSYDFITENTSDDLAILAAEIDSTINISPLSVIYTNTSFVTTTTEYYTSEDFCSLFANLNEAPSIDLNIYPNPATDFVNIELGNLKNEDLQNAVIVVYDMTGKKVFEKQLNNSSMEKISTADYAAGLYTIIIANSNNILAKQRVIVQK